MRPRNRSRQLMRPSRLCLMSLMMLTALSGCATDQQAAATAKVTANTYCQIAGKVTWSVKDTPATIAGVSRENAKIDRLCAKPPKTS